MKRWNLDLDHEYWDSSWNFQVYFNAPGGSDPLALDMGSMGKGQVWINGQSIGRYWTAYATGNCSPCTYAATYRQGKCQSGCGQPTQRWYADNSSILLDKLED